MWEEPDHKGTILVHMFNVVKECMRWSRKQGGAHRVIAQAWKKSSEREIADGLCAGMCA
jgi:hypothetical protein